MNAGGGRVSFLRAFDITTGPANDGRIVGEGLRCCIAGRLGGLLAKIRDNIIRLVLWVSEDAAAREIVDESADERVAENRGSGHRKGEAAGREIV